MKKLLFIISVLVSFSANATLLNISAQSGDSFNAVIVEKDKKRLHVVKVTGEGATVIKSVTVMTGKMKGDKNVAGDEKTPEGYYRVMGFLSHAKLQEMYGEASKTYGYGAYPLNYPNTIDSLKGKTGGGIWIHGVEEHRADPATKGCVAFNNDEVKIVGSYLSKGTPVVITTSAIEGSGEKYHKLFADAKNAVLKYLEAWQNNDFKGFSEAYGKEFLSKDGKRLNAYLGYKKNLMSLYPNRKIAADKFRVFYESENEAVVEFNQYYSADNITAFGRKTLFMKKENGMMRIIAEDFEQTKGWDVKPDMEVAKADIREPETDKNIKQIKKESVKPVKPVEIVIEDNTADVSQNINNFLVQWKTEWEKREVDSYITLYDDSFKSNGMNKKAWKEDKARKFAALSDVCVEIEEIKISVLSAKRFEVSFRQKYKGDGYTDTGIKTLRLTETESGLRIVSEQWRAE